MLFPNLAQNLCLTEWNLKIKFRIKIIMISSEVLNLNQLSFIGLIIFICLNLKFYAFYLKNAKNKIVKS